MSDIPPITGPTTTALPTANRVRPQASVEAPPAHGPDRVDLSHAARLLSRLHELPEIRQELVNRVKPQVRADTYVTADKINAALDELLADL